MLATVNALIHANCVRQRLLVQIVAIVRAQLVTHLVIHLPRAGEILSDGSAARLSKPSSK